MHRITLALVLLALSFGSGSGCASFESRFLRAPRTTWQPPERAEILRVATPDGGSLSGWLFQPTNDAELRGAAIVIAHGRGDSMADYRSIAPELADSTGAAVVVFDYRGFGASSDLDQPTRRTMIDDTRVLLDAVTDRDDIDSDRVTLWGVSLGGYPAIAVFAQDPSVHSLMLWGAPANIRDVIADGHDDLDPFTRLLAWFFVRRDHAPEDQLRLATGRPVLIAHAESDSIIAVRHAHALNEAARASSGDVTLLIDEAGTHTSISEGTLEEMLDWYRARAID